MNRQHAKIVRMNMGSRLQRALEARGWTAADLVRAMGVSKGMIYNIINGKTRPDRVRASTIETISQKLGICKSWLASGVGTMREEGQVPISMLEREGAHDYVGDVVPWGSEIDLPSDAFAFLFELSQPMTTAHRRPHPPPTSTPNRSIAFRADYMRRNGWTPETHYILRCQGEAMHPTIQDAAPVVIDTSAAGRQVHSGRIYAVNIGAETQLRRLDRLPDGRLRVRADNPSSMYAAIDVTEDSLRIIGRAVWTPTEL